MKKEMLKDGNFAFTSVEPLTGKQVLLIVSDAAGNPSRLQKQLEPSNEGLLKGAVRSRSQLPLFLLVYCFPND